MLGAGCVAVDAGLNNTGRARCAPGLGIWVFVAWVCDGRELNAVLSGPGGIPGHGGDRSERGTAGRSILVPFYQTGAPCAVGLAEERL